MIRVALALAITATLSSIAPVQCSHNSDANTRRDDAPGDVLWGLAADFRAHNDEPSARATLKYLVDKYPSSRHADEARSELADHADHPAAK